MNNNKFIIKVRKPDIDFRRLQCYMLLQLYESVHMNITINFYSATFCMAIRHLDVLYNFNYAHVLLDNGYVWTFHGQSVIARVGCIILNALSVFVMPVHILVEVSNCLMSGNA